MKILLISASPHKEKSRTFILAKEVLRGALGEGIALETIHLCDFRISFCRHWEECHKKILHCSVADDAPKIMKKMLEVEGIILASPNYINQVTGLMKTLFDRAAHFIHCKRLLGKYIVGVVSSGSGYDQDVLGYINFFAHTCGAQYSGGVSSRVPVSKEKLKEAYELGRKFVLDIKEKKAYPDQIGVIEKRRQHFKEVIKARKEEWEEEYRYWQDKGWL
ncbi:flavodoxin family protein [bacterium]|nr:MAG: flavodoxin family protein [bacterium]